MNINTPNRNKDTKIRTMGIILFALFIPFYWLSVAALVLSTRIRRGITTAKAAYVVLFLQLASTIWACVTALTDSESNFRYINDSFAFFMFTFTALCGLILFTPKFKFEKNR